MQSSCLIFIEMERVVHVESDIMCIWILTHLRNSQRTYERMQSRCFSHSFPTNTFMDCHIASSIMIACISRLIASHCTYSASATPTLSTCITAFIFMLLYCIVHSTVALCSFPFAAVADLVVHVSDG